MKYEILVFSCPNCAGMVKFKSETCSYCGAPFYWLEDGMDKKTMLKKAKEIDVDHVAVLPGGAYGLAYQEYTPKKVAASQWAKKLYIVATHVDGTSTMNTVAIDEVRFSHDGHKTVGEIHVDVRNERSTLFFDWLRMHDEYFQVQVCEEGEPLKMMVDGCKVTGMEVYYGFPGQKVLTFESSCASRLVGDVPGDLLKGDVTW